MHRVGGSLYPVGGATGCPATFGDVTGLKFVSNYSLARDGNPRQGMEAGYTMAAGDPANPGTATANRPGDIYTNRFALSSGSLTGGQYLRSNSVSVQVASYPIGDLVFEEANGDGDYDPPLDTPAPDGTVVELHRTLDDSLVSTYTIDSTELGAGRYLFPKLGAGDYYIVLPGSVFAAGGAMDGWFPTSIPAGALENDDNNDTTDQHGYTPGTIGVEGLRTNSMTLSADPPPPGGIPQGHEPLGDNTGSIADITPDAFSNLTLDVGVVPPRRYGSTRRSVPRPRVSPVTRPTTPTGPRPPRWTFWRRRGGASG